MLSLAARRQRNDAEHSEVYLLVIKIRVVRHSVTLQACLDAELAPRQRVWGPSNHPVMKSAPHPEPPPRFKIGTAPPPPLAATFGSGRRLYAA